MTGWGKLLSLVIGLCGGLFVAGGLFAFLVLTGIIIRLAAGTKTAKYMRFYESMALLGCASGNIQFLFMPELPVGSAVLWLYGLGSGIFTGCLAAALAEVVNVLPVLSERVALKKGMAGIMFLFAVGKLAGSLFGLLR